MSVSHHFASKVDPLVGSTALNAESFQSHYDTVISHLKTSVGSKRQPMQGRACLHCRQCRKPSWPRRAEDQGQHPTRCGRHLSDGAGFEHVIHVHIDVIYVRTYVRTHARTYVRKYVCTYVCTYVRKHVCMHVCMYACMHACMHACM